MIKQTIQDIDNIIRHCGAGWFDNGQLLPRAFQLKRDKQEVAISVNWLEFHKRLTFVEAMEDVTNELAAIGRHIGATSQFARLNVGRVRREIAAHTKGKIVLEVQHEPIPKNSSHSEIHGMHHLNRVDEFVAAHLLCKLVEEFHPPRLR